jgi:AcrR family transcriptional regulator
MPSRSAKTRLSPSCLHGCARKAPTQRRGEAKVASLLAAAIAEFAASGYEGATMSAIAERAGTAIGSLYQFFPNKEAVARTVRTSHVEDVEAALASPDTASVPAFVAWFSGIMLDFVHTHPAYPALQDAPASTQPIGPRNRVRKRLVELISLLAPNVPTDRATQIAEAIFHVNKSMMAHYANARKDERPAIANEYRTLLESYLRATLTLTRAPASPHRRTSKSSASQSSDHASGPPSRVRSPSSRSIKST